MNGRNGREFIVLALRMQRCFSFMISGKVELSMKGLTL